MGLTVDYPTKGDQVRCEVCMDHITTFAKDLKLFDQLAEETFEPKEGQGPWKMGEPVLCRKCGTPWCNGFQFFTLIPKEFIN